MPGMSWPGVEVQPVTARIGYRHADARDGGAGPAVLPVVRWLRPCRPGGAVVTGAARAEVTAAAKRLDIPDERVISIFPVSLTANERNYDRYLKWLDAAWKDGLLCGTCMQKIETQDEMTQSDFCPACQAASWSAP